MSDSDIGMVGLAVAFFGCWVVFMRIWFACDRIKEMHKDWFSEDESDDDGEPQ